MRTFSMTDVGKIRQVNQDYIFTSENPVGKLPNLFIVADGMGGHNAGDFASRYTVETVVDAIKNSDETETIAIIRGAIEETNRKLIEKANEDVRLSGMGTTIVLCTIDGDEACVANVGDSRLYLLGDKITQITKDHSWVEEMVKKGELTESQARIHPQKNIITRALGIDEVVHADYFEIDVKPDDKILMCSDGLTNMVEDEDIEYIIRHSSSIEKAVENLVEKANENGGKDNITVILVQI